MSPVKAQETKVLLFPSFRHVDPASNDLPQSSGRNLVLLADGDFAPWSFKNSDGVLEGLSVEIARLACNEAKLNCDIQAQDFEKLMPALQRGEVQGVVSGPRLDVKLAEQFALTRPYFQSLGRFAVRTGSPLATPDSRSLAGRRLGFRAKSAHAKFLEKHYNRSTLVPFETHEAILEALRTGQVDSIFGDAVQLSFWLQGQTSRGCCAFLGKAFVDRSTFTRSLSFILQRDDADLRVKFDAALDRLETSGKTAEVFARYLPTSIW